jgi:hypothetical protein
MARISRCGHMTLALMDSADRGLISWSGLEPTEAVNFLSICRMTDCAITHITLASLRHGDGARALSQLKKMMDFIEAS